METDKKPRITQEKRTVEIMIRLYCRKKEKNATLCPECEELLRYAHARLDHCPFGEKKSSCKKCSVHCYKPAMRERMREGYAVLRSQNVALCSDGSDTPLILLTGKFILMIFPESRIEK